MDERLQKDKDDNSKRRLKTMRPRRRHTHSVEAVCLPVDDPKSTDQPAVDLMHIFILN